MASRMRPADFEPRGPRRSPAPTVGLGSSETPAGGELTRSSTARDDAAHRDAPDRVAIAAKPAAAGSASVTAASPRLNGPGVADPAARRPVARHSTISAPVCYGLARALDRRRSEPPPGRSARRMFVPRAPAGHRSTSRRTSHRRRRRRPAPAARQSCASCEHERHVGEPGTVHPLACDVDRRSEMSTPSTDLGRADRRVVLDRADRRPEPMSATRSPNCDSRAHRCRIGVRRRAVTRARAEPPRPRHACRPTPASDASRRGHDAGRTRHDDRRQVWRLATIPDVHVRSGSA